MRKWQISYPIITLRKALHVARSIEPEPTGLYPITDEPSEKNSKLQWLTGLMAYAGQLNAARMIADEITDDNEKTFALLSIAGSQLDIGRRADAIHTVAESMKIAYREIAIHRVKGGDVEGALSSARTLKSAEARAYSLLGIADVFLSK